MVLEGLRALGVGARELRDRNFLQGEMRGAFRAKPIWRVEGRLGLELFRVSSWGSGIEAEGLSFGLGLALFKLKSLCSH